MVLVGRRYGRDIGVGRRGEERGDVQVDALAGCVEFRQLLGRVAVEAGGVGLEAEEELGDGDASVAPHVEEEHGVGAVQKRQRSLIVILRQEVLTRLSP